MANILYKIFHHKEYKQEKERLDRIAHHRWLYGSSIDDILIGDNMLCIPDIENETSLVCHVGDDGLILESLPITEYSSFSKNYIELADSFDYKITTDDIDYLIDEIIEEDRRPERSGRFSISSRKDCISLSHENCDYCYDMDIRHSISRELTPEEIAELEEFRKKEEEEAERLQEIEKRLNDLKSAVRQLLKLGLDADQIYKFIHPEKPFSRLRVTEDLRIIVPEKDNLEIELKPLPRALYILFLKHPEGINFKDLVDYKDEIQSIYNTITNRVHLDKASKSVEDLVDPTNNSVHEKCSRIKGAFMKLFGKAGAEQYAITGKAGEAKTIPAARGFVDWEKK